MPKVSAKRQITIPIDQCQEMQIKPGDEVETFIHNGQITLVKKEQGAAKGILKDIHAKEQISDEESLQSSLNEQH